MLTKCPICQSTHAAMVHAAEGVPILMNRLYDTPAKARAATTGQLEIMACQECGFGWNKAFDPNRIIYDEAYENDQMHSPAFARHVEDRALDIIATVPQAEPIDILEIGCGQGRFIAEVARLAGPRLRSAVGFDPAWRGADGGGPEGCRIHKVYFDDTTSDRLEFQPNVVVSRHTIEHIPRPLSFLTTIRRALGSDPRARLFLETPSFPWIIANGARQDLFYEHCSIFSDVAMTYALRATGFGEAVVGHVFGGQYLWATAITDTSGVSPIPPRGSHQPVGKSFNTFLPFWKQKLADTANAGRVAIWGAGAKGVTFSLLIDPEGAMIDHVIDINPSKQGRFIGGSGLPVLSPAQSFARAPATIIVMNPNYLDEITSLVRQAGATAELVAIE